MNRKCWEALLTCNDTKSPKSECLWRGPKQGRLKESYWNDHGVESLVVVGVDRRDVGHVGKLVPIRPVKNAVYIANRTRNFWLANCIRCRKVGLVLELRKAQTG